MYSKIARICRLHYKDPKLSDMENRCCVLVFEKLVHPIPAQLYFGGMYIGFKYTGQFVLLKYIILVAMF